MKKDVNIKNDVLDELEWEPSIDATRIGVVVEDGIVTLNGHVNTYEQMLTAEKAARRVDGVMAVVQNIYVNPDKDYQRNDKDLKEMILYNLKWNASVPEREIEVKVERGWVTLKGNVKWNYQKIAAEQSVRSLIGVHGIDSHIMVSTEVTPRNVKEKIRKAFTRNANIDAEHIHVEVKGSKVILSGTVQSWAERKQAERAAWATPGVTEVVDKLVVHAREHYLL